MKDQFVTYEIALKLKELGFDEDCLYYFDSFKYIGSSSAFWDNYNKSDVLISRPLWQQAIDFLKERKVLVAERWDGWEYGAYDWDDFIYTDTKEEAILKAIEICQKENNELPSNPDMVKCKQCGTYFSQSAIVERLGDAMNPKFYGFCGPVCFCHQGRP